MKRNIFVWLMTLVYIMTSSITVLASNTTIKIEDTTVSTGEEIVVPVKINENSGICGATFTISYDRNLTLTDVVKGEALPSLVMTMPGNMSSNPFKIVYDGMEADATNGVIAYLHFEAMSEIGSYDISIAYEDGDVVDGELNPISVEMLSGRIVVGSDGGDNSGGENDDENSDGNEGNVGGEHESPTLTVGKVVAKVGESVEVPIRISGNSGICGATFTISYDRNLTLADVVKGEALSSLVMTMPGNMSSNPIKLVWDGLEEDTSNGVIAILIFEGVETLGEYSITVTYEDGDIVDGELDPVEVVTQGGSIQVGETTTQTPSPSPDQEPDQGDVSISVDRVSVKTGEQIEVPIRISGNTGICGATFSISYDSNLTLTDIVKGEALSSLVMTMPGNLSSDSIKLVWDGLEEDTSNGVIATLIFEGVETSGEYSITVTYEDGDIVDGELNPVKVDVRQGKITADTITAKKMVVNIEEKSAILDGNCNLGGKILVAFYDENKILISVEAIEVTDNNINVDGVKDALYAKIMWWNDIEAMQPICDSRIINF